MTIEASPAEREALASLYELPAIAALTATLRLDPAGRGGARVTGAVHGEFTQTCVVSLEPFPGTVDEVVDMRFAPQAEEESGRRAGRETLTISLADEDDPDPVVDGKIDLGALTAEIFALGLDPYPRKPGVAFDAPEPESGRESPFAPLAESIPRAHDRLAHVLDATRHGRQALDHVVGRRREYSSQRRLAGAGRAPEDHRGELSRLDQTAQRTVSSHQMILTNDLVQGAWAQQLREGRRVAQSLGDGVVKERRGSRSLGA